MENCIFCDLINENDPIKIPEQGKDYSIIKGMFIKGLKVRKRVLQLRNHWWLAIRIPTVKLKIPGKAFLKSESQTSVTFILTLAIYQWERLGLSKYATMKKL